MSGDGFQLREEAHAVRAHCVQVSEERVLMTGEPEHAQWNRDPDIDADHASVRPAGKLAGEKSALSVNHRPIAELIIVHQCQTFLEVLDPLNAQHRSEDLLIPHRHARLHMIKERRPQVKAFFKTLDRHPAPVQDKLGTLIDPFLDPICHELTVTGVDQGSHLAGFIIRRPDLQLLHHFDEQCHQLVGDRLLHDHRGKGHTSLTGAAAGRVDNAARRALQGCIPKHNGVVLRFGQRLNAFPVFCSGGVDVPANRGGPYETYPLHVWVFKQDLRLIPPAGDQVDHAFR